jgi:hypothetical protein
LHRRNDRPFPDIGGRLKDAPEGEIRLPQKGRQLLNFDTT